MIQFKQFTGGDLETHAYLLKAPEGNILFDAPFGADEHFASERVDLLLLTHGHFDHIANAARIRRRHKCPVGIHPDSAPMLAQQDFFKKWGFFVEIESLQPDLLLEESSCTNFLGLNLQIFLVPGHCPGSLCFLTQPDQQADACLFGGDVLFRGGVGRWDLPGGNREILLEGIRHKLLTLPDKIPVYPGHGPSTTIGFEKRTNPFLVDLN